MKYLVIYKKTQAELLFEYNDKGFLKAFSSDIQAVQSTVDFYRQKFPFTASDIDYYKNHQEFTVKLVAQDLGFKNFWNTYAHKVGNKKRAEKLWDALTEVEKVKALSYLKTYDRHLIENRGISKLYPETYLNQKRFNND